MNKRIQEFFISMTDEDLELMRAKGYDVEIVSIHTSDVNYVKSIGVHFANFDDVIKIGFYGWLDNLQFHINNKHIKIEDQKHLESCFKLMDSFVEFAQYLK